MNAKIRLLAIAILLAKMASALSAQEESSRTTTELSKRSDVLLICDFDVDDWWTAWGSRRQPINTALVVGDKAHGGTGRSLQVTTPRGEHTGTSFAYKFRERLGAEPEEIYFRYYLKLDPDWKHATSGGKLPGISGTYGRAGWGGRKVNGSDGWSARGLFETRNGSDSTAIGFYCYHADMRGRYGENWRFQPRLEHGKWYCVEQYCKLNTPGEAGGRGKNDGILRGWIDGKVAFEKTDIRFRDVDSLKIEEVWVNIYHGGERPVPNEDIHLYLDNLVIARQPIGPLGAAATSTIAPPRSGPVEKFKFRHHYIDRDLPGASYGQTCLVDIDKDGDLDFITGGKGPDLSIFWFEFQAPGAWVRHVLGTHHLSDVGGMSIDVDGDGWLDHVTGGVWYRNTGRPRREAFQRIVFAPGLKLVPAQTGG